MGAVTPPLPLSAGLAGLGVLGPGAWRVPAGASPGGQSLPAWSGTGRACCMHAQLLSVSLSTRFPNKNTGGLCHFLLQGIFPTQGSNLRLLCLLHCRWVLYCLSCLGSPSTWQAPPNPPAIPQVPAKPARKAGGPEFPHSTRRPADQPQGLGCRNSGRQRQEHHPRPDTVGPQTSLLPRKPQLCLHRMGAAR